MSQPDDLDAFRLDAGDALFLDFDGTLAELGPDPDAIALPPGAAEALVRLAARLGGALALLSGRDIRDLARRTPAQVWRLGGHGLETLPPGAPVPPPPPALAAAVLAPLHAMVAMPGVRLELKGPVAALHYRAAPDAEAACLAAANEAARLAPDLVAQAGKMVVEVKPVTAHKGTALRRLMQAAPFAGRRPVMLGDDTTDEDAIAAAQDLGGVGIKVGPGPSAARLRTPSPASVRAWLARAGSPHG
ncbi:MAG: trehalose-phosphatase [Amaricoccus sp.]|uniref:trehalose-phosphatase n=1 Tax=Amaricoccus sp. TaxID=1872485 RepID=UPI0039E4B5E1